jgi:hypothetical protein
MAINRSVIFVSVVLSWVFMLAIIALIHVYVINLATVDYRPLILLIPFLILVFLGTLYGVRKYRKHEGH